ncbi:hypothetical protein [Actinomadura roseirufa]|uniref:hypothetical protein n=1 Tax=Actinomadura roseirufa TaxID=2094049 RepID=UPI0010416E65|nr:hypothetical protein [Actinomadura roseirufa]
MSWSVTLSDIKETLGEDYRLVRETEFYLPAQPNRSGGRILAEWTPAGPNVRPEYKGISIDVDLVVTAVERAEARSLLRAEALPVLRAWVVGAHEASEIWKDQRRSAAWTYEHGTAHFHGNYWPR